MPFQKNPFLVRWLITTLSVLVAANIVSGIAYDTFGALLVAALLLGILNAVFRPLLLLLSLPLLIATLGFFVLIINAMLLYFVGWLVGPFHVGSFGAAFWGGVVISLVSITVNMLCGTGTSTIQINKQRGTPRPRGKNGGSSGPVIDV